MFYEKTKILTDLGWQPTAPPPKGKSISALSCTEIRMPYRLRIGGSGKPFVAFVTGAISLIFPFFFASFLAYIFLFLAFVSMVLCFSHPTHFSIYFSINLFPPRFITPPSFLPISLPPIFLSLYLSICVAHPPFNYELLPPSLLACLQALQFRTQ